MKAPFAAAGSLGLILFAALAFSAEVPLNQAQFDAAKVSAKPSSPSDFLKPGSLTAARTDLPASQRGFDNDGCCLLER
jgi:hypothetical protein